MNPFKNMTKKIDPGLIFSIMVLVVVGFLIFSSVYTVQENQVGVLKTFGKASRITGAGIHVKLPYPFEQVTLIEAGKMKTLEIGMNTTDSETSQFPKEAAMLTKDDSLVWINILIDWKISDPVKFISTVDDPEEFIHNSTLQIVRKKIGAMTFNDTLIADRTSIEASVKKQLTTIFQAYDIGVSVEDVRFLGAIPPSSISESFAKIDAAVQKKNASIESAKTYAENKVQIANTNATTLMESYSTYREETLEKAKAETAKFESLYREYQINKSVTRSRLYFEMLEEVLPNVKTIIIGGQDGTSTVNVGGKSNE